MSLPKTSQWLSTMKNTQLKNLAFLAGVNTSGLKAALTARVERELFLPRLPATGGRILSVDMGIRNLAFCVVDVYRASKRNANDRAGVIDRLEVVAWRRISLLDGLNKEYENGVEHSQPPDTPDTSKSISEATDTKDAFTPASLSKIAYTLVSRTLLPYNASTFLIERQRFRSGGGSAVLEWTVRVNTLESMIWAVLETLKHQEHQQCSTLTLEATHSNRDAFPDVFDVSPQRVGGFWMAGKAGVELNASEAALTAPISPTRAAKSADKKEKIEVVGQWLSDPSKHGLSFTAEADETRHAFLTVQKRRKKSKGKKGQVGGEETLDDLADCLLQAVAWTRWEENRRRIIEIAKAKEEKEAEA
ncbi:mitochondrial resolvase Ydc2 [Cryomyces antarcticus]